MAYPSLVREDKFRDVLEVVKVEDGVDGRPRVHERDSALLFGRDLLDDLLESRPRRIDIERFFFTQPKDLWEIVW